MIKIALKSQFFSRKTTIIIKGWGLCPQTPSVICLSCYSLFSKGPKLDNVCGKNLLLAQFPFLLAKFWLSFWSHLLLQTDFSSDYMGRIRNELRNAAGVICLFFSDMNTKFLKWRIISCRKILVFICESSVYFGPPNFD